MLSRRVRLALVVALASAVVLAGCGSSTSGNGGGVPQPDASAEGDRGTADSGGGAGDGSTSGHDDSGSDGGSVSDGQALADSGTGTTADGAAEGGAGPLACGTTWCRDGETCAAGLCVSTGCVGAKVPGDYLTVGDAVVALGAAGGTICLAAQVYPEDVNVLKLTGSLTIVGVSAAQTTVRSFNVVENVTTPGPVTLHLQSLSTQTGSTVTFSGSQFTAFVHVDDCILASDDSSAALDLTSQGPDAGTLTVDITATTLVATAGGAGVHGVDTSSTGDANLVLTLDGDDLSASTGAALWAVVFNPSSTVTVRNSYLHDSANGLSIQQNASSGALTVVNDTFVRDQTAAYLLEGPQTTFYNNLFDGNDVAIDVSPALAASSFGDNALWNDTTNYFGYAVAGTGYVTGDPKLDTSTPPGLQAGSSCVGAGNATYAPATDYWGRPRGSSVDIGAVQTP